MPVVSEPVLEARDLLKDYVTRDAKLQRRTARAVDGVSFQIGEQETFGVVGESGCGKSTIGRVLLKLYEATGGEILLFGENVAPLSERRFRGHRRKLQMVFQDPQAAFDPMSSIRSSLREYAELRGLRRRAEQDALIERTVEEVGLPPELIDRKPSEVSGGQLQRLNVARCLLVEPKVLFLDEPTASLDVSIRGQIVNLLLDRQESDHLSYLLVSHDLRVVYAMAHRVAVMYLGQFVEVGTRDQVYERARHPYTRGLLDAADLDEPRRDSSSVRLAGEISDEVMALPGCRLMPRCPFAEESCESPQELLQVEEGHLVRCWKAVEQPGDMGLPVTLTKKGEAREEAGKMIVE